MSSLLPADGAQTQVPIPADFVREVEPLLGTPATEALLRALKGPSPVSVRLNERKTAPIAGEKIGWCESGRYLDSRPQYTLDPLWHAGCFYAQEASSMFIEQAFRAIDIAPRRMLDLCAAPGGKSTHWRALLPPDCLLVANEPVKLRANILNENLAKWGWPNVVVSQNFPHDFAPLTHCFDLIAADVPCSGEGMFRKDPGARTDWSLQKVEECAALQYRIVADVWNCLVPGGYLIYSTCTYNRAENEDNVVKICEQLGAEMVPVATLPEWEIDGDTTGRNLPVYHFFPHHSRGEGFFLALLRKNKSDEKTQPARAKKNKCKPSIERGFKLAQYIADNQQYGCVRINQNFLVAQHKLHTEFIGMLAQTLHLLTSGICLFEEKNKKLIPQTDLALSTLLQPDAFPSINLSLTDALRYLRHEALVLDNAPRGYVLACFDGHPIGFLNNIGSRANNLYPKEWRIRNL